MSAKEKTSGGAVMGRTLYLLMIAAAIFVVAAFVGVSDSADKKVVPVMAAVASAMLAVAIVRAWSESRGEVLADERTKLVQRVAAGWSWWFTYLVIAILMLAQEFGNVKLDAGSTLSLLFFCMIASLIAARAYLSRKADLA